MKNIDVLKLKEALEENVRIGDTYKGGWNDLYKKVGLEALGLKNLNGGKQKNTAKSLILQYAEIKPVEEGKRALVCTNTLDDIDWSEMFIDGRGKGGFYIDRMIPILLHYFVSINNQIIITTVSGLSQAVGIINEEYEKLIKQRRGEIEGDYSPYMIGQFLRRCKPRLEEIVFRSLDRLEKDHQSIEYFKEYRILTNEGEYIASPNEEKLIHLTEKQVLKDLGLNSIRRVYDKRLEKTFYSKVCRIISNELDVNWETYYQQIRIFIKQGKIDLLMKKMNYYEVDTSRLVKELRYHLSSYIKEKTEYDIEYTHKKEAESRQKNYELIKQSSNLVELIDAQLYSEEELIEKFVEKCQVFRYPDGYAEIQDEIRLKVLGKAYEEDAQEIGEIDDSWMDQCF